VFLLFIENGVASGAKKAHQVNGKWVHGSKVSESLNSPGADADKNARM
jgi:hypothetical protein